MSRYIDDGLRRRRRSALPIVGAMRHDDNGRCAQFSLRVERGVIHDVAFDASVCVTLLAFCELAAEAVSGRAVSDAMRAVHPVRLVEQLQGVPAAKRDCARLASQAMVAALVEAVKEAA